MGDCAYTVSVAVKCLRSESADRLLAALTSTIPCGGPLKTTCSRLRKNNFMLVSSGEG